MKIKTIITCLLALVLAMPAGDAYAQTRKKGSTTRKTAATGTKKTATTTSTKSSSKSKSSVTTKSTQTSSMPQGGHLEDDLVWGHYRGLWLMDGLDKLGSDVGLYVDLSIYSGGEAECITTGSKLSGSWKLNNNTLIVSVGALKMTLVSNNIGKTLTGEMSKDGTSIGKLQLYQLPYGEFGQEGLKKAFYPGESKALIKVTTAKREELLFPCEFNSTPNEDGNGGSFKISIDNALGIGLIKGTYTIDGNKIKFVTNLGEDNRKPFIFEHEKAIYAQLGYKNIDGSGKSEICLYLLYEGR